MKRADKVKKIAIVLGVLLLGISLIGCKYDPNKLNMRYSGGTLEKYYIITGNERNGIITNIDVIIPEIIKGKRVKTMIIDDAFGNAPQLRSLKLSSRTIRIGKYAFSNSTLSEVIIPADSTLKIIDVGAFQDTRITKIFLPQRVEFIGENCFQGIANLTIYTEHDSDYSDWNERWTDSNVKINFNVSYADYILLD